MKTRVTFETEDPSGMVAWAKSLLEEEGFVVARPNPLHAKETPQRFCERIGIHPGTFSRKVRLAQCPTNFECERTATGRIMWLRASEEFEHFMRPITCE